MNISSFLAILWGITIVIVSSSFLLKPNFLEKLISKAESKTTMFLLGIITLVVGVVMVLIHNVWFLDWRVVVTIIGWLTLLKGLDLLLLPKRMGRRWSKLNRAQWKLLFMLLLLGGVVLTYLGFFALI